MTEAKRVSNFTVKKCDPVAIAPQVYEIVKHSFTRDFDHIPETLDQVIAYIQDSDVYMVYESNVPAGYFVLYKESPEEFELKSIAVAENYQGKGIGKIMMDKVDELCGDTKIKLVTHPKNIAAILMYLKHGYIIDGWINDYLGDGQPRLSLTKNG